MKLLKKFLGLLVVSAVMAPAIVLFSHPGSYESEVVRAEMAESGSQAQAALAQYPDSAPRVFALYGQTPEFQDVLRRFGHNQIVPIVTMCLEGGDSFLQAGKSVGQVFEAITSFKWPEFSRLTPEECGYQAIKTTALAGSGFLDEFVIEGGIAHRVVSNTALGGLKRATIGGLQVLEKKYVLGQAPSVAEVGLGALDLAGIAIAGKGIAAVVKGKLAVSAAKQPIMHLSTLRGGVIDFTKAVAPRFLKYGAVVGVVWVAAKHPNVISGLARSLAEWLNWPVLLTQIGVWTILLLPILWVVPYGLIVMGWIGRFFVRLRPS